jgi:transposase InsO family protein
MRSSTPRSSTASSRSYGLAQEFILPHTPEQNGVAESFMGTLKLECITQHRFATYKKAKTPIHRLDPPLQRDPTPFQPGLPHAAWRERHAQLTA